jgi:uncharacterized membrane protein YbhN (UPF0104 family)
MKKNIENTKRSTLLLMAFIVLYGIYYLVIEVILGIGMQDTWGRMKSWFEKKRGNKR